MPCYMKRNIFNYVMCTLFSDYKKQTTEEHFLNVKSLNSYTLLEVITNTH